MKAGMERDFELNRRTREFVTSPRSGKRCIQTKLFML
jgi:hypothetical protein